MSSKTINKQSITVPSRLDQLVVVEELAEKVANSAGMGSEAKDNLAIAVTEAVNNAIVHGNKNDASKKVLIEFLVSRSEITATVKDQGGGFKPDVIPDPTIPENILKENGRGIFILKAIMNRVEFSFSSTGTTVKMICPLN